MGVCVYIYMYTYMPRPSTTRENESRSRKNCAILYAFYLGQRLALDVNLVLFSR